MAKSSINCEVCGAHLEHDTDEELATVYQKHAKDTHDMEMSREMFLKKVKMAQEGEM